MTVEKGDISWVPDHQLHVIATLAHVDALVEQVGRMMFDYMSAPGPLDFYEESDGVTSYVRVRSVRPIPEALARTSADAMNQMRAALEHALFAEVQQETGRELTEIETSAIKMPTSRKFEHLVNWSKGGGRATLSVLQPGQPLWKRIEALQPFQRTDAASHPMRVLAEHTNFAKHRTPSIAATHLGMVHVQNGDPRLKPASELERPLVVGDVVATAQAGAVVPLVIWPKVAIQRPHQDSWHVLMHELRLLEEWVREIAVPVIITGEWKQGRSWSPAIDVAVGHDDFRTAAESATAEPAAIRADERMLAVTARVGLQETIAVAPDPMNADILREWVATLTDAEAIDRVNRFAAVRTAPLLLLQLVRDFEDEATQTAEPEGDGPGRCHLAHAGASRPLEVDDRPRLGAARPARPALVAQRGYRRLSFLRWLPSGPARRCRRALEPVSQRRPSWDAGPALGGFIPKGPTAWRCTRLGTVFVNLAAPRREHARTDAEVVLIPSAQTRGRRAGAGSGHLEPLCRRSHST